jgi:hypothetical protein
LDIVTPDSKPWGARAHIPTPARASKDSCLGGVCPQDNDVGLI